MGKEQIYLPQLILKIIRVNFAGNKCVYLGQGYQRVDHDECSKLASLNGYTIDENSLKNKLIELYSSWPKRSELWSLIEGKEYFSKTRQKWVQVTKRNFDATRSSMMTNAKLRVIWDDIKNTYDPLETNIDNRIIALVAGLFATDGTMISEKGIAIISMTRAWYKDLLNSIAKASKGNFHIAKINEGSNDRMVQLVFRPNSSATKSGVWPNFYKFSAWLAGTFGFLGQKKYGFSPYPSQIVSWSKELKQIYLLGCYIGDGSVSIGKTDSNIRKPSFSLKLFCKPTILSANWLAEVKVLVNQVLDSPQAINDSKTNTIALPPVGRDLLINEWSSLKRDFNLADSYKTDALLLVQYLTQNKYNQIPLPLREQIEALDFKQKDLDTNYRVGNVLAKLQSIKNISKINDYRNCIGTSYFNPNAHDGYEREVIERHYSDIFQGCYSLIDNKGNPATTRALGQFIKNHKVIGQHYRLSDEVAIGKAFLKVVSLRNEIIERQEWKDILKRSAPPLSDYLASIQMRNFKWSSLIKQLIANEEKYFEGRFVINRSNRALRDALAKHYKNMVANTDVSY